MRVAAPFRMLHSPGVLRPAAKPGRTPRRSATARIPSRAKSDAPYDPDAFLTRLYTIPCGQNRDAP